MWFEIIKKAIESVKSNKMKGIIIKSQSGRGMTITLFNTLYDSEMPLIWLGKKYKRRS